METSNFRKSWGDPRAVAICLSVPRGWTGKRDRRLAPTQELFAKGNYTYREYKRDVLAALDPHQILAAYKDSVLLCWEGDPTNCHRRMVARWIEESTGVVVPEHDPEPTLF